MIAANDQDAGSITMPRAHAEALTSAGNLLSEVWGALASGDPLTLGDLDRRMVDAGLAEIKGDVAVISPELTDAIIDTDVALGRAEGDEVEDDTEGFSVTETDEDFEPDAFDEADDIEADVAAAETRIIRAGRPEPPF